jgi:ATP-binding cassette subfamily B protein
MAVQAIPSPRRPHDARGGAPGHGAPKVDLRILLRAIRYVGHYRWIALLAYGSLVVATGAQLMVPQLVQSIIDTVVKAFAASQILGLPANAQSLAAQKMGETTVQLQADQSGAPAALITISIGIVGFAIMRALFSFSQQFNAERLSQNLVFDFRNELFAKIQRLSFSYHDRNQTGQLMIRATDDVEKVRLFIGQGLVMTLQAFILLAGALIVLWFSNHSLTLVILPTLPIALAVFMVFGAITQPLFTRTQQRLSVLNTVLQENLAGFKVVKAFAREPQEQARFDRSADALLVQQFQIARTFAFLMPFIFLIASWTPILPIS